MVRCKAHVSLYFGVDKTDVKYPGRDADFGGKPCYSADVLLHYTRREGAK